MPPLDWTTDFYKIDLTTNQLSTFRRLAKSYKEVGARSKTATNGVVTYFIEVETDGHGALVALNLGANPNRQKVLYEEYGGRPKYPYKRYHPERFEIRESEKPKIPEPNNKRRINLSLLESENNVKQEGIKS